VLGDFNAYSLALIGLIVNPSVGGPYWAWGVRRIVLKRIQPSPRSEIVATDSNAFRNSAFKFQSFPALSIIIAGTARQ
jgi:hypothetical protein